MIFFLVMGLCCNDLYCVCLYFLLVCRLVEWIYFIVDTIFVRMNFVYTLAVVHFCFMFFVALIGDRISDLGLSCLFMGTT